MANVIDLTVSSDSDSEVEDHDLTGDLDVELGHSDSDVEGHDSDVEGHDSDVEGHDSDVEDHDSTGESEIEDHELIGDSEVEAGSYRYMAPNLKTCSVY